MLHKLLLGILLLFFSASPLYAVLENVKTINYDVGFISLSGNEYRFNAVRSSNKVAIKYMLSPDGVFEIDDQTRVLVEIEDSLYVDRTEYDINANKAYFSASGILRIMIDNDITDRRFRFTSCVSGSASCTYSQYFEVEDNTASRDDLSYLQYYKKDTRIDIAKHNLKTNFVPTVAIIDDGVNINHEELIGQNWTNPDEIEGNGIDDDNNGYIDDYYGWNFVDQNNNTTPKGSHGTNVAGVIGAVNDNGIGIAGIIENVQIMPLTACSDIGCSGESIKWAIKYAVDNGANIINMSLGGEWFSYNSDLNEAIDYASDRGVILVVAAGNGDSSFNNNGVDTTVRKISPVCGGSQAHTVIGVSSTSVFSDLTKDGLLSFWSNYGKCADVSTYGESIVSINLDGGYDTNNGTSFSAPIITGIIGIGFSQYGPQSPEIVHKSMLESVDKWYGINAATYLDRLSRNIRLSEAEKQAELEASQVIVEPTVVTQSPAENSNKYIQMFRDRIGDKLRTIPKDLLQRLIVRIDSFSTTNLSDDFKLRLIALRFVIQETLDTL